mmetsp:Transcript_53443/g.127456  ORF Transcript_53443/g.127456 Transcript_53443/m.127456 type:complete len:156 (-) Transcript_53443:970-1437(-)
MDTAESWHHPYSIFSIMLSERFAHCIISFMMFDRLAHSVTSIMLFERHAHSVTQVHYGKDEIAGREEAQPPNGQWRELQVVHLVGEPDKQPQPESAKSHVEAKQWECVIPSMSDHRPCSKCLPGALPWNLGKCSQDFRTAEERWAQLVHVACSFE